MFTVKTDKRTAKVFDILLVMRLENYFYKIFLFLFYYNLCDIIHIV